MITKPKEKNYEEEISKNDRYRKILMPIADAQQLMVIADDFCVLNDNRTQDSIIDIICRSKTYNDGLRKVIDIIDATVLAS